jgi:hypothetical protein
MKVRPLSRRGEVNHSAKDAIQSQSIALKPEPPSRRKETIMIIAHYGHRLPADYDIGIIRSRARARGHLFDAIPNLAFKAFLLRERGSFGAITSEYSSLYLWREDEGFRNFLVDGRYKSVTDSFGRAQIETRVALDALRGSGREARFLYKQEQDIALDTDLTSAFAAEIERNREVSQRPGAVAAAVGVDVQNWKFTRVLLSENEPGGREEGAAYQVLYLAKPLLAELPQASLRQREPATV